MMRLYSDCTIVLGYLARYRLPELRELQQGCSGRLVKPMNVQLLVAAGER